MQRNSSVLLIVLTAVAILFALISLIACLTGECWYGQVLPAVGFVSGLFALASLFASLCLLFASTSPKMVIITRATVIIVVFILSLISGVLFAIGTRVCLAETFGSCYLFYYSKSFIVASSKQGAQSNAGGTSGGAQVTAEVAPVELAGAGVGAAQASPEAPADRGRGVEKLNPSDSTCCVHQVISN
ncbi:hypothetical protein Tcan_12366 [Toxocara canis]|uniref:Uncharacterized protein n=1 Tax=Toxocara canis TaxID=6265 RepID=A0A0B2VWS8_TOXCA|nr:hypothetical protein Tcan_12366 [Toxocara canis]